MKEFSTFADGYDCSDCQSSEKEIRKLKSKIEKLQKAYEVLRGAHKTIATDNIYVAENGWRDEYFLSVKQSKEALAEAEEILK